MVIWIHMVIYVCQESSIPNCKFGRIYLGKTNHPGYSYKSCESQLSGIPKRSKKRNSLRKPNLAAVHSEWIWNGFCVKLITFIP